VDGPKLSPDIRPEFHHAFGTPVIAIDFPNHEAINAELEEVILTRRENDDGMVRSNVTSWHSDEGFIRWGGPHAQFLAKSFANICSGVTEMPSEAGANLRRWVVRMWANVFEEGAFNRLHFHPGAFWSAVYYVSDGREMGDEDVGGNLVLHSPHESVSSMYAPDVHIKLPNGERLSSTLAVRPRPGLGVIFPSWLMHEVDPYRGKRTRISIALNLSLTS
jgi:uncharacterized protein (TIGR02466 family)